VCDTLSTGITTAEAALSQVHGDECVAQEPCLSTRLEQLQAEGLALEAEPCEDSAMDFVRCVAAQYHYLQALVTYLSVQPPIMLSCS
jgi:hypothetical protein